MFRFFWWFLPLLLWGATILVLTSIPDVQTPELGFKIQDKFYHFLVYIVFGFLFMRASMQGDAGRLPAARKTVVFYGTAFALADEVHQIFIPGRYGEWSDALADVLGILSAVLLFSVLIKFMQKHNIVFAWKGKKLV